MAITIIDEKRQHVQNDFEDRVEAPPPWWVTPGRSGPTTAKSSRPFLVGGDQAGWPDRSSRSLTYAPSERAMTFALKRTFRLS